MEDLIASYLEASKIVNLRRRQLKKEFITKCDDRFLSLRIDVLTEEYNDMRKAIELMRRYTDRGCSCAGKIVKAL